MKTSNGAGAAQEKMLRTIMLDKGEVSLFSLTLYTKDLSPHASFYKFAYPKCIMTPYTWGKVGVYKSRRGANTPRGPRRRSLDPLKIHTHTHNGTNDETPSSCTPHTHLHTPSPRASSLPFSPSLSLDPGSSVDSTSCVCDDHHGV